jgi:hypothetical protein
MTFRFIPLLVLGLGLSCAAARAQAPAPTVSTEILTLALNDPVADLFFHNGKEVQPFQANLTGLGQPLAYKGPRRFAVRASAAEFAAKPPLPDPVAAVDLPLDCNRVLMLCMKSGQEPLKLRAYDISTGKSKAGDYRFFNFSRQPISVILGGAKFALPAGRDTNVSEASWGRETLDLPMQMAVVQKGKAKLVFSAVWGHRPGRRNFVFLFDGKHPSKPVGVYRFFDVPSAAAPAGAP